MAKYVLIYKGGTPPATPEEGQAVMQAWIGWYTNLGAAVADPGNPFGPSAGLATDGTVSAAAPSGLTGYTVITADSLAAATEHAKACPQLAAGGTVEIYETYDVM